MWDFHVLFAMERWRRRSGVHVRAWLDSLGTVDALATLAIARADEPDWVMPQVEAAAGAYTATALAHPLIAAERRVANDVSIGPAGTLLLVTGSNMSGKSTLLRAIGLNAALAQAGGPVCAAALKMPAVELQTSIRVQDSLELGLSYFMAALARLKQIVDAAARHRIQAGQDAWMLMYLLDEVLQGTNSVERGVAVRGVAQHLLDMGAIGAMTTHDLALVDEEPLRSAGVLVHFTETVHAGGAMTFDYRLRPGLATSTNALRLMQAIGIAPR
jgi:DNA mismatch repair ATPase MutS